MEQWKHTWEQPNVAVGIPALPPFVRHGLDLHDSVTLVEGELVVLLSVVTVLTFCQLLEIESKGRDTHSYRATATMPSCAAAAMGAGGGAGAGAAGSAAGGYGHMGSATYRIGQGLNRCVPAAAAEVEAEAEEGAKVSGAAHQLLRRSQRSPRS